jgi:PIN domain nuclease of toxin-antitoxin system
VTVLDASAVLAFLQGEPGAEVVSERLDGAVIGAANWSEVRTRLGGELEGSLADAILVARGVRVEPLTKEDADRAALLTDRSLSLGDRLCLALGRRLGEEVLTADRAWGSGEGIVQIR